MAIDTTDIGNPHKEILECINTYIAEITAELGGGGGGGGGDTVIYKAVEEIRNSTTTLTLDDELQFEADAHGIYELDLRILTHCGGGSGMLAYKIELPSTVSGVDRFMITGNYNNASSVSYAAPSSDDAQFGYVYVTLYASQPATVHLRCNVIIGGTGGTVGFKWAQATSSGTDTVLMKGSTLKYRKLN